MSNRWHGFKKESQRKHSFGPKRSSVAGIERSMDNFFKMTDEAKKRLEKLNNDKK